MQQPASVLMNKKLKKKQKHKEFRLDCLRENDFDMMKELQRKLKRQRKEDKLCLRKQNTKGKSEQGSSKD